MKNVTIIMLLLFVISAQAQKQYENEPESCHLKFIFEDTEQYIFYESSDSILIVDFLKGLEDKHIEKLKGVMKLQIMIDTAQQICLVSYLNNTNISDKKLDIVSRVKSMPGWKRVAPGLENENICTLINLYFDKYDYKIQHIGYNRNTGKQLLESFLYKRHAIDSTIMEAN